MGCDDGVLLSDRKFAGADVVATSYALSAGIRKQGGFDLIVCGKQTTDGDTAQVGPEIAEHLGIPHISYVDKIVEIREKSLVVSVSMDKTMEEWEIDYPCLITVDKGIFTPRAACCYFSRISRSRYWAFRYGRPGRKSLRP